MTLTLTLTLTSSSPPKAASAPEPDLHTPSKSAVAAMSDGRAVGLRKSGEELYMHMHTSSNSPINSPIPATQPQAAHPRTAHYLQDISSSTLLLNCVHSITLS